MDDPSVLYDLGIASAKSGDMPEAARQLNAALVHAETAMLANPTSAAATLLAKCLVAVDRKDDAAAMFARRAKAATYDLLMCFAQIFTQLGQREHAIAAYDAAAAQRPLKVVENTAAAPAWALNSPFTASNPSPRYGQLLAQYELMHQAGKADAQSQGAKTFEGFVGWSIVAPYVRRFSQTVGARSLLDYGGGRGMQYRLGAIELGGETFADPLAYLGIERVACFDPGFARELPTEMFDLVICVDALEHCDRQDLPWIVRQLFEKARLGVFANIAAYPAAKTLPDGENAHCTVEDASWWMSLFRAVADEFPTVGYQVIVSKDLRQNTRTIFGRGGRT